jgi:hypothetical protein
MKLLALIFALLSIRAFGAEWSIRWEAAKGDSKCSIPYAPRSLDAIQATLPSGHPEANADIKNGLKPAKSSSEVLGTFEGRKVVAVELEVPDTYYARYFMIVAEVEVGKFMPVYIHQYAPGAHGHGKPSFAVGKSGFSITVTSTTRGTSPSEETFRVTSDLKSSPKTEHVVAGSGG